jgi:peptidoglycan/xylan/chitin deacetylase (PgdA/CDA1 family)
MAGRHTYRHHDDEDDDDDEEEEDMQAAHECINKWQTP